MQPYTYLITFKPNGKKYYGVKFAKDSNPDTLWTEYFTSSKVIKELIEEHGIDAFDAEIDRVFSCAEDAVSYEIEYLQSINDKSKWLNNNFGSGFNTPRSKLYKTKEHCKNIAKSNSKPKVGKALEACIENGKKGSEARRGMKDSEETKRKRAESLSKALTGVPQLNRRKRLIINGKTYYGFQEAMDELQLSRQTIYARLNSDEWDWYYATKR